LARLFRPGLVQRAAFCKRYAQVNVCAGQIVYHRVDLHTVKPRSTELSDLIRPTG
jgi:hypothetical protein